MSDSRVTGRSAIGARGHAQHNSKQGIATVYSGRGVADLAPHQAVRCTDCILRKKPDIVINRSRRAILITGNFILYVLSLRGHFVRIPRRYELIDRK